MYICGPELPCWSILCYSKELLDNIRYRVELGANVCKTNCVCLMEAMLCYTRLCSKYLLNIMHQIYLHSLYKNLRHHIQSGSGYVMEHYICLYWVRGKKKTKKIWQLLMIDDNLIEWRNDYCSLPVKRPWALNCSMLKINGWVLNW